MSDATTKTLLIVEDDPGLQSQLRWSFADDVNCLVATDPDEAITALRRDEPQVVTLDLGLPPDPGGTSAGFALLGEILRLAPSTKVIVVTGREEHSHALHAISQGAYDYYQKPVDADALGMVVERAFKLRALEDEVALLSQQQHADMANIIGASRPMRQLCRMIEKVGPANVTTLIEGETGTGKELVANAVHSLSTRKKGPFVAINCAAIPDTLLESELFGYEKGAFTGATSNKQGRIEAANGGTLFLDEIGDMPPQLQAKLLRFLQERTIERVGSTKSIEVDVRVLSATHQDLQQLVTTGGFREDLYYRLAEIVLTVPPLRDREDDAVLLAQTFVDRYAKSEGRKRLRLADATKGAIVQYPWRGNVRELENKAKRAVVLADGEVIQPMDMGLADPDGDGPGVLNLKQAREQAERDAVIRALAANGNNVAQTSRALGVTRPTLYSLMTKFGLDSGDD